MLNECLRRRGTPIQDPILMMVRVKGVTPKGLLSVIGRQVSHHYQEVTSFGTQP
jgi:hypothetical protein